MIGTCWILLFWVIFTFEVEERIVVRKLIRVLTMSIGCAEYVFSGVIILVKMFDVLPRPIEVCLFQSKWFWSLSQVCEQCIVV